MDSGSSWSIGNPGLRWRHKGVLFVERSLQISLSIADETGDPS